MRPPSFEAASVLNSGGLPPPYGDRATYGAGTGANRVVVVARFDDPHSVFPPYNLADVMGPDDYRAYAGRSCMTPARPIAREIVFGAGIAGYKVPHLPTAPSRWTRAVAVMSFLSRVSVSAASGVMMRDATVLMMRPSLSRLRKQERCREGGRQGYQLHAITPNRYAALLSICQTKTRQASRWMAGQAEWCCLNGRDTRFYLSAMFAKGRGLFA